MMSERSRGRAVGSLFWLAFAAYLSGSAMMESQIAAGALLMLLNSAAVLGIAVIVLSVLKRHDEIAAYAYLVSRTAEAVLLAIGVVFLMSPTLEEASEYAYQIAMIAVGIGGVIFSRVLFRARLVPGVLAMWGLVGYALLAVGAMLEIIGYGVGLALSVPGGLFELALGALLIGRGFPVQRRPGSETVDNRPPVASGAGR